MGLFSFFKKHRKEETLNEVISHYEEPVKGDGKKEQTDKADVKRFLLEHCHAMEESAKEYHTAKQEYQSLTSYLTDIQTLENMDEEDHKKLFEYASSIITLEDSRKAMEKKVNRLPDSKFYQMDREKENIPKDIERLKENEDLQNLIKRDMDYLEGEKVEWIYEKGELSKEQSLLQKISRGSILVLALFLAAFVAFFLMENKTVYSIILAGASVMGIVVCGILIRLQNIKSELKRCTMNYNRAVNLQNSIKLRYVTMKNAVDYTCERYGVSSSRELEKNWQLYLEAAMEREKMMQADDDLTFYKEALLTLLRQYQLYDAGIWVYQVHAIVDHREMVEVKHLLLERRQKVRTRMENAMETIKENKKGALALAKQHRVYPEEMKGLLESVQKLISI